MQTDLGRTRPAAPGDVAGLDAHLASLVGEAFRFARVSYGDELTLHFGDVREARSAKLRDKRYGAYIVGVRGSAWIIKAGKIPSAISAGVLPISEAMNFAEPIAKEQMERDPRIEPGSRVVYARSFPDTPDDGFGLSLGFSDGGALFILPSREHSEEVNDSSLPALANWDLLSPHGLLSAGPGLAWEYKPSADFLGRGA